MFPLREQHEELAEEMKENSVAEDGNIGGCFNGFVRRMKGGKGGDRGGGAAGRAAGRTRFSCLPKHYHQQVVQFSYPPCLLPSLVATLVVLVADTNACNGYQRGMYVQYL